MKNNFPSKNDSESLLNKYSRNSNIKKVVFQNKE